jgi:chemotaxis protein MotB
MVTFSDCMTLLLTFFVMLLSFSSFDPKDLTDVLEGFEQATQASPFANKRPPREAYLPDNESLIDRTEHGSETPTFERLAPTTSPPAPQDPLSSDAYRDRRVLHIPSDLVFWGRGTALKPEAAEVLGQVARFLRLVPCRVAVREIPGPRLTPEASLRRAVTVMRHFTETEGLPAERFVVSAAGPAPEKAPREAVLRIDMLNREVYP